MRPFLWWLGKELREHRLTLLLLAVVLLLGSRLIVELNQPRVDLGDLPTYRTPDGREVVASPGPLPHSLDRRSWEGLVVGGLGLVVLVLAGGLFSGEARRGTLALIARTPRAWRPALAAKLVFLLLVAAAAVLLQGTLLARLAGPYRLMEEGRAVDVACLLPRAQDALLGWIVLGLGAWMLVASAALPLVGVPALVGAVIGVGTLLPAVLWHARYRFLLRWWLGDPGWFVLAWSLVALGLVAWSWLRPLRYGARPLRVALRSLAVAGLFAGAATAVLASTAARYRTFDAHAPDLRILDLWRGAGGRFAFAAVARGDPEGDPASGAGEVGTPPHAWRIDLTDGAWAELGGEGRRFQATALHGWPRPGTSPVLTLPEAGSWRLGDWIDTRTGEVFSRGRVGDVPPDAMDRIRGGLKADTRVRDRQGRRVWRLGDRLEREGAEPMVLPEFSSGLGALEIVGGWATFGGDPRLVALGDPPIRTLDAEDGTVRTLPPFDAELVGSAVRGWLDPRHAVVARPGLFRDAQPPLFAYRVLDLATGSHEPLLASQNPHALELRLVALFDRQGGLALAGAEGSRALAHVSLPAGELTLLSWEGPTLDGVESILWVTDRPGGIVALPGQHVCLTCYRRGPSGANAQAARLPQRADTRFSSSAQRAGAEPDGTWSAVVCCDAATRRAKVLSGWTPAAALIPWSVEADGAVLCTEAGRRIVRLGPEPGQRTVLFPK